MKQEEIRQRISNAARNGVEIGDRYRITLPRLVCVHPEIGEVYFSSYTGIVINYDGVNVTLWYPDIQEFFPNVQDTITVHVENLA